MQFRLITECLSCCNKSWVNDFNHLKKSQGTPYRFMVWSQYLLLQHSHRQNIWRGSQMIIFVTWTVLMMTPLTSQLAAIFAPADPCDKRMVWVRFIKTTRTESDKSPLQTVSRLNACCFCFGYIRFFASLQRGYFTFLRTFQSIQSLLVKTKHTSKFPSPLSINIWDRIQRTTSAIHKS